MSLFTATYQLTVAIDAKLIHDGISEAAFDAWAKIGAAMIEAGRSQLRPRKRASRPGEAPSVHATGRRSLLNMAMAIESGGRSVIAGPVNLSDTGPIPGRLERTRPYMRPALRQVASSNVIRDAWTGAVR